MPPGFGCPAAAAAGAVVGALVAAAAGALVGLAAVAGVGAAACVGCAAGAGAEVGATGAEAGPHADSTSVATMRKRRITFSPPEQSSWLGREDSTWRLRRRPR